ncbi:MAG: general secretion pathway protein GspM [Proteobacteria bacterium]|nr:general secretion pathway protein GspM [Pseudomonadota bacterium]MBU4131358.1 general secretion pathway protein GspM [Pseudomonadota bacterium]
MGTLSIKDKNVLTAGGILVVIFMAIQFVYLPAVDKREDLKRILSVEKQSLNQIRTLQKQYLSLAQNFDLQKDALKNRQKNFSLFSFLDLQAEKSGVKDNIDYMKPFSQELENSPYTISKVKLKLKDVFLNEFIDFMHGIEASENSVRIISLSLSKTGKNKDKLDAVIETQTLVVREPV